MLTSKIRNRSNVEERFENAPTFGFIAVIEDDEHQCWFEKWRRLRRNKEECGLGVLAICAFKLDIEDVDQSFEVTRSIAEHARVDGIGMIVGSISELSYDAKIAPSA